MKGFLALLVLAVGSVCAQDLPEYQLVQNPTIKLTFQVLDPVALEKRADYLLYDRRKVLAPERRKLLRPGGVLDVARCIEILVGEGMTDLHGSVKLDDASVALLHEYLKSVAPSSPADTSDSHAETAP